MEGFPKTHALCHMTPPVTLTLQQSYRTRVSLVPVKVRFPLFMAKLQKPVTSILLNFEAVTG